MENQFPYMQPLNRSFFLSSFIYLFLSLKVPTFRLSGSSVLPAYPGFIVMNTAHDGLSASSTPSNMKRSACKKSR